MAKSDDCSFTIKLDRSMVIRVDSARRGIVYGLDASRTAVITAAVKKFLDELDEAKKSDMRKVRR